MKIFDSSNDQHHADALKHLRNHGYIVLEGLLSAEQFERLSANVDQLLASDREQPFDPGVGPALPEDQEMADYLKRSYKVSEAELARVMKRIRYSRAQNEATSWPVPADQVNHNFMHIPLLVEDEKTQRSYNLPARLDECDLLIEHPVLIKILDEILDPDFILSAMGISSVGPHTNGGYWHVDAPLTMCPEPLPNITLGVQTVWMIDQFTADNGATRVIPGSHKTLKKPPWSFDTVDGEIPLTAPAGCMALWLSHTWHRFGPNHSDRPRRAIIGYYARSWINPSRNSRGVYRAKSCGAIHPARVTCSDGRHSARREVERIREDRMKRKQKTIDMASFVSKLAVAVSWESRSLARIKFQKKAWQVPRTPQRYKVMFLERDSHVTTTQPGEEVMPQLYAD